MRPTQVFTSALLLASASTTWSQALDDAAILEVRQDDTTSSSTSFDLNYTGKQGNTATTITSSATLPSNTASDSTATITSSGSNSDSSDNNNNNNTTQSASSYDTTKTFAATLPAGGVSLITPSAAATSYYKIKDNVQFVWNYTSLYATPSAVDVLVSCSSNAAVYTLASNMTIGSANATQTLIWDTGAYQATGSPLLLTAEYTLIIHDASKDIDAAASPGYLASFDSYTFGMYIPQPKVDLADFKCSTCNSATSLMDKHTMSFMCGMAALTVLSFGWFGGVAGLW